MASSDSQIDKPQRGCPERAELPDVKRKALILREWLLCTCNVWIKHTNILAHHCRKEQTKISKWTDFRVRISVKRHDFGSINFCKFCMGKGQALPIQFICHTVQKRIRITELLILAFSFQWCVLFWPSCIGAVVSVMKVYFRGLKRNNGIRITEIFAVE